jgi:hypothetical protein
MVTVSNTFVKDHAGKSLYLVNDSRLYYLNNRVGYHIDQCKMNDYTFGRYLSGVCVMGTHDEVVEYCKTGPKFVEATPNWTKKTKVAFYGSSFPSLLLGRLGGDIKRTTNAVTADYIITDSFQEYKSHQSVMLVGTDKNDNCVLYNFGWSEDETKIPVTLSKHFPGYTFQWICTCSVQRQALMDVINQDPTKFIKTSTFIKHVYSSVAIPDDEEMKSLISMITSKDQDLGFNTLVYYNFFDYLPNIYQSLLNKGVESNNSSAKFVYYILDTVFSRINGLKNGSTTQRLNELGALKQNTFMTNQALTNLQKILNDQVGIEINNTFKNALDAINAHVVIVTNDA